MLAGRNGRRMRGAKMGRHLNEGNTFTKEQEGEGPLLVLANLSQATFIQKPRRGLEEVSSRRKPGRVCCLLETKV